MKSNIFLLFIFVFKRGNNLWKKLNTVVKMCEKEKLQLYLELILVGDVKT